MSAYRFPSMNFTKNDCRLYEDAKYLKYIINSMIKNLCSEKLIGTFFCTTNIPIQIINTCICFVIVPLKNASFTLYISNRIHIIKSCTWSSLQGVLNGKILCGYDWNQCVSKSFSLGKIQYQTMFFFYRSLSWSLDYDESKL